MERIEQIIDILNSDLAMESNYVIPNYDVHFLLNTIESQKEEIDRLREVQKVLVLTPMQRMSRAFKTLEEYNDKAPTK